MGPASYGRQTKKGHESACNFITDACWKKFVIGKHFRALVVMCLDACLWSPVVTYSDPPTYGGASCRDDHITVITTALMRVSYRIKPYE